MLTAVIIDDEFYGRENLKKIIETYCHEIKILGCADSVVNGKDLVAAHNPNVVFLDINMPELDGFDFLEEYDERSFMVVFVSAHKEFGINALKAGAVDYVLKPVNIKELKQTVKKLLCLQSKSAGRGVTETDKIVVPASHGFNIALIEDIIRLEAMGCYTKIYTKDGKNTIVSRTLKDFEDNISKDKFFRTHKSHLINIRYVKEYSSLGGNYVIMTDGSKVEISRRKVSDFIHIIKKVLKVV